MNREDIGKKLPAAFDGLVTARVGENDRLTYSLRSGEVRHVAGRVLGWRRSKADGETPTVVIQEFGTGKLRPVAVTALRRYQDSQQPAQTANHTSGPTRCRECGKPLGAGPHGFLDEDTVPGFCFDCA